MVDGPESLSPLDEQAAGITRRQALKRGAILGGALAWATPVVQVIGMQPAFAQTVSPACQIPVTFHLPVGDITVCFEGPAEMCECINACTTDACVVQCLIDFPPTGFSIGPCV